jgi:type VI protein secretion system component Hcp
LTWRSLTNEYWNGFTVGIQGTADEVFPPAPIPLTVLVSVWTPTLAGSEVILLTYKLVNASVASIRPWMPNKNDPSTREYPPAEEISFTYQKIELEFHNGGIIAEDDWEAPRAAKSAPEKR